MPGAIIRQENMKRVRDLIVSQKDQIAMALPRHLNADRLSRIALTAIRTTPQLLDCDPASLLGAVIQSAQLGLEPDNTLGQAYLVPYKRTATLMIGYKGMIELARRSGRVSSISARVVYERDQFDYSYGLDEHLDHKPASIDRGEPVYVYAVARFTDGGHAFEVMTKAEVDSIRSKSPADNSGPWVTHYQEMMRKTAIRRLFKYLPISIELQRAVALDEQAEAGIPQQLDAIVIDEVPGPENYKEDGNDLADKLGDGKEVYDTAADCKKCGQSYKDGAPVNTRTGTCDECETGDSDANIKALDALKLGDAEFLRVE